VPIDFSAEKEVGACAPETIAVSPSIWFLVLMPRKNLIRSSLGLYHLTNRSNNKEWFYIPLNEVWEITTSLLTLCSERYGLELYAYVLMSNHYHMIVGTPQANIDAIMRFFQTEVARAIQRKAGRINHVFGNRYKWSFLRNASAVACGFKYVLRNPVRATLTSKVEAYRFSSFHPSSAYDAPWISGIHHDWDFVPRKLSERISWLNQPTTKEAEELVTKALRRTEFKFSQGNEYAKRLRLLEEEYGVPTAPATFSAEK
jgi:putative transposase